MGLLLFYRYMEQFCVVSLPRVPRGGSRLGWLAAEHNTAAWGGAGRSVSYLSNFCVLSVVHRWGPVPSASMTSLQVWRTFEPDSYYKYGIPVLVGWCSPVLFVLGLGPHFVISNFSCVLFRTMSAWHTPVVPTHLLLKKGSHPQRSYFIHYGVFYDAIECSAAMSDPGSLKSGCRGANPP